MAQTKFSQIAHIKNVHTYFDLMNAKLESIKLPP